MKRNRNGGKAVPIYVLSISVMNILLSKYHNQSHRTKVCSHSFLIAFPLLRPGIRIDLRLHFSVSTFRSAENFNRNKYNRHGRLLRLSVNIRVYIMLVAVCVCVCTCARDIYNAGYIRTHSLTQSTWSPWPPCPPWPPWPPWPPPSQPHTHAHQVVERAQKHTKTKRHDSSMC